MIGEQSIKRAVVDIGSNSVRLVIYEGPKRAPVQICNEKALCGLGRGMTEEGALNPEAAAYALVVLRRFRMLLAEHGNPETFVIATAAVRQAIDGPQFVEQVNALGFDVSIINGAREAELAALGVVSAIPDADGLVGDMGGGSLELASVRSGSVSQRASLSIGPFWLMQKTKGDIARAKSIIDAALDGVDWLKPGAFDALYAVGGAWRAVARIHMRFPSYPLPILHNYELSHYDALGMCELISKQSRRSLEQVPGIPRRRIDTLPFASLVLHEVLLRARPEQMIVSAGGVREGLLFDALTPEERKVDPLLIAARHIADRMAPDSSFGEAVSTMVGSLFKDETAERRRLRKAICALIDIGAFFHPDMRGEHVFDTALRAALSGISHQERIMMAYALFVRHEGRRSTPPDERLVGLLSWDEQQYAIKLGLAMRFAADFSPKASPILSECALFIEGRRLIFRAPEGLRGLMEDLPRRRLEALADAIEAEPVEDFSG